MVTLMYKQNLLYIVFIRVNLSCKFLKYPVLKIMHMLNFLDTFSMGVMGLCPDWYPVHIEVVVVAFVKSCRRRRVVDELIRDLIKIMFSISNVNCCCSCC